MDLLDAPTMAANIAKVWGNLFAGQAVDEGRKAAIYGEAAIEAQTMDCTRMRSVFLPRMTVQTGAGLNVDGEVELLVAHGSDGGMAVLAYYADGWVDVFAYPSVDCPLWLAKEL